MGGNFDDFKNGVQAARETVQHVSRAVNAVGMSLPLPGFTLTQGSGRWTPSLRDIGNEL